MKAVTTLLLATAAIASAASLQQQKPTYSLATFVAYDAAWARGMLQGFQIGFFKKTNFVNDPKCLDAEWQGNFVDVFGNFSASFNWIAKTAQISSLLTNLQTNCQFDETLFEYLTFCYSSQQCLITYMFQTLMTKVF